MKPLQRVQTRNRIGRRSSNATRSNVTRPHASSMRSHVLKIEAFPAFPTETPCFRIDRFTLDLPALLRIVKVSVDWVLQEGRLAAGGGPTDRFKVAALDANLSRDLDPKPPQASSIPRGFRSSAQTALTAASAHHPRLPSPPDRTHRSH